MQPFTVLFQPSQWQFAILIGAHLAVGILDGLIFNGWQFWGFLIAIIASLVYALFNARLRIGAVEINHQGKAFITLNQQKLPANLLSDSLVHPWITLLHWQQIDSQQKIWQCVLPDSCSHSDFRRLRVWEKFYRHQAD